MGGSKQHFDNHMMLSCKSAIKGVVKATALKDSHHILAGGWEQDGLFWHCSVPGL